MSEDERLLEVAKCYRNPAYWVEHYVQIEDATEGSWIPFGLWREQASVLRMFQDHRLSIVLKARQLGLSWLVLAWALYLMLFRPSATVLLFSRRDDEAVHLLDHRLKGMARRLPEWMQPAEPVKDNDHEWRLQNGSAAYAFPTTAGDSYTATLAIVDEADLVPDLGRLMRSVKPTIDGGGSMILLSRADKSAPASEFKRLYRAAKGGEAPWAHVFLPWHVRPGRSLEWYEEQRKDSLSRTGSLDDLHEQYPATDAEALAPKSLDKRIPAEWATACYQEQKSLAADKLPKGAPSIPGLSVFKLPEPGRSYRIGADPAEGNPTSDDSAASVLDALTGEEVANLAGKFEPSTFASYIDLVGCWFNRALVLVERNNHGHAVLLWLFDNSSLGILDGYDNKPGWLSNTKGKALMYDALADAIRDKATTVHDFEVFHQIASIEGATLRAPKGEHDDRSDAHALAVLATNAVIPEPDQLVTLPDSEAVRISSV